MDRADFTTSYILLDTADFVTSSIQILELELKTHPGTQPYRIHLKLVIRIKIELKADSNVTK